MYKNSETASEHNLQEMKRKILDQIDRTIEASPLKSRRETPSAVAIVSPDNQNNQSRKFNTSVAEGDDEQSASAVNLSKNLRTLKTQIIEKDRAQDESVSKMKGKASLMHNEMDSIKQQLVNMKDTIKNKDREINDLEAQLENTRNHFASRKSRENVLEKSSEDMQNTVLHLKNKVQLRKAQIAEVKEEMSRQQRTFNDEKRRLLDERVAIETNLNVISERFEQERFKCVETEKLLEKARWELQSRECESERMQTSQIDKSVIELSGRLAREQEIGRELRVQNQLLEKKIIEQERQMAQLEEKAQKNRKKFEEEKVHLLGDRKSESDKRKQKNKKLKVELKSLEERASELAGDGAELRAEKDRLNRALNSIQQELALKNAEIAQQKQSIAVLQEDVDTLKHSVRDGDLLLKREQQEYKRLERDQKGLSEQMKARIAEVRECEFELEKQREVFAALEEDYLHQVEVNRQQQDLILKIERQNQFLTDMQNRDIDKLEEKVGLVNQESGALKRENDALRSETVKLKSEIDEVERELEAVTERANKYKKQVNVLKHSLVEADEKLRELIYQKHNQIRQDDYDDDE